MEDDPHEGAWDHLGDPEVTCQECFHEVHKDLCSRNRCGCVGKEM